MNARAQRGTTLVIGLILLSLVTLLGLAGAGTAHVEQLLAQNELFRENAASAASAGIEAAISHIVITMPSTASPVATSGLMPGSTDRYETVTRFVGFDLALPQSAGAHLAGAHFEIVSSGFGSRRAVDRQRADIMLVVDSAGSTAALDCEPALPAHCFQSGELVRLSWQRVFVE